MCFEIRLSKTLNNDRIYLVRFFEDSHANFRRKMRQMTATKRRRCQIVFSTFQLNYLSLDTSRETKALKRSPDEIRFAACVSEESLKFLWYLITSEWLKMGEKLQVFTLSKF